LLYPQRYLIGRGALTVSRSVAAAQARGLASPSGFADGGEEVHVVRREMEQLKASHAAEVADQAELREKNKKLTSQLTLLEKKRPAPALSADAVATVVAKKIKGELASLRPVAGKKGVVTQTIAVSKADFNEGLRGLEAKIVAVTGTRRGAEDAELEDRTGYEGGLELSEKSRKDQGRTHDRHDNGYSDGDGPSLAVFDRTRRDNTRNTEQLITVAGMMRDVALGLGSRGRANTTRSESPYYPRSRSPMERDRARYTRDRGRQPDRNRNRRSSSRSPNVGRYDRNYDPDYNRYRKRDHRDYELDRDRERHRDDYLRDHDVDREHQEQNHDRERRSDRNYDPDYNRYRERDHRDYELDRDRERHRDDYLRDHDVDREHQDLNHDRERRSISQHTGEGTHRPGSPAQ
jgi:hypothetical protein